MKAKATRPVDDPVLNARELLYAASRLKTPRAEALIATVMSAVTALAHEVAEAHGCKVSTWTDMEHNESRFTDGPIKKLQMLADLEGAL